LQPQRRTDRELPAPPPPSSPLAEEAQTIIQEMVNKMGLHAVVVETQVPVSEAGESTPSLAFDILGDDLGSLIGRRGQTLSSMQYLVNLIMRQRHKEPLMVLVDVEGYRARRYQTLQNLAQRMAERVRSTGQTVTLEPMTAAERRIIHMTLKEFPDLSTQSVGEGENRKVTIVPKRQ
jgi:spoIIIJ-associated protein